MKKVLKKYIKSTGEYEDVVVDDSIKSNDFKIDKNYQPDHENYLLDKTKAISKKGPIFNGMAYGLLWFFIDLIFILPIEKKIETNRSYFWEITLLTSLLVYFYLYRKKEFINKKERISHMILFFFFYWIIPFSASFIAFVLFVLMAGT